MQLKANVKITVMDKDNWIIDELEEHNLVVNTGLNWARDRLAGLAPDPARFIAIGTGNTAVTAGDTELEAEVHRSILTGSSAQENFKITFTQFLTTLEADGEELREVGLFSTDGVLIARATHAAINKSTAITVSYQWDIELAAVA